MSLKMVKESSILYKGRRINSPKDAIIVANNILNECDREKLVVCCLNTKNEPTCLSVVSMRSLNSSVVHPREVFKTAIINNAASILMFHNHRRRFMFTC